MSHYQTLGVSYNQALVIHEIVANFLLFKLIPSQSICDVCGVEEYKTEICAPKNSQTLLVQKFSNTTAEREPSCC